MKPKKSVQEMSGYKPPLEGRIGMLRLDFNENTGGCSPNVLRALASVRPDQVCVYPEESVFKQKLASYLTMNQDQILLTNGADEAIKVVMETFLEPQDETVLPTPTFALFRVYASSIGAKIKEVPYRDDMSFPLQEVLGAITPKTKLVVLVSPNNPTGTRIAKTDICKVLDAAKNAVVIVDEAYIQYSGPSVKELVPKYSNLFIIQTFSKAFGLAGLRLGYCMTQSQNIAALQKVRSPYSVNTLALVAGNAALDDLAFVEGYITQVKKAKLLLCRLLTSLGIRFFPSDANFILAYFGCRSEALCTALKAKGILVRSMTSYPELSGCVRLGVGTVQEIKQLVAALTDFLPKKTLLFDMDGVLVDVSCSYREAIKQTVGFFTGENATNAQVQTVKEQGGFNNDWDATEELLKRKGKKIPRKKMIETFQNLYWGIDGNGLVQQEKWLLSPATLKQLSQKYRLGIVTGRTRTEAEFTLTTLGVSEFFDVVVVEEYAEKNKPQMKRTKIPFFSYPQEKSKPQPYPLQLACSVLGTQEAVYFGDSVDDMRCAKKAGVKAIGVLPPFTVSSTLDNLLKKEGAQTVIRINDILKVIS